MPISVSGGRATVQDSRGRTIGNARTVDSRGRTQTHTTGGISSRGGGGGRDIFGSRNKLKKKPITRPIVQKTPKAVKPPVTPTPVTPAPTPITPAPVAAVKPDPIPKSNKWSDIVGAYFPSTEMKAGGIVRGCGVAKRGKGRGVMK